MNRRLKVDDLIVISPRLNGRVLDVSSTGMRIATTTRLKSGEHVSFRLVGDYRAIASAVVRWCELDSVFEASSGEILSLYHVGLVLLHEPRRLSDASPAP